MRPNWIHGRHPPACTCVACSRKRVSRPGMLRRFWRFVSSGAERREEKMRIEREAYVAALCHKYDIRRPLLYFEDQMANPGACGEAGGHLVRLKRDYFLKVGLQERQRIIRHELAHISVQNAPGWENAAAHGSEFGAELARIQ